MGDRKEHQRTQRPAEPCPPCWAHLGSEGTSLCISVFHVPDLLLLALQDLTGPRGSSGRRAHCFKKLYYGHESKTGTELWAPRRQVTSLRLAQPSSFFQRALFHLVLTKSLERRQAREEGYSLSASCQWGLPRPAFESVRMGAHREHPGETSGARLCR